MPLPRYHKLSPERKEQIINAALEEFANHHYQDASINRIIERSGVSKGTMYYYFADKADVYSELIKNFIVASIESWQFDTSVQTSEQFWEEWRTLYRSAFKYYVDNPEQHKLNSHFTRLIASGVAPEEARKQIRKIRAYCLERLNFGIEIGAVRSDLPESLLVNLFISLYEAFDSWVAFTYETMSLDNCDELADMISKLLKKLLAPH
jgi:AcrR family transcriptional regulator